MVEMKENELINVERFDEVFILFVQRMFRSD
jgi:hypothetical protein